jgi:hypothetical protein
MRCGGCANSSHNDCPGCSDYNGTKNTNDDFDDSSTGCIKYNSGTGFIKYNSNTCFIKYNSITNSTNYDDGAGCHKW